MKTNALLAFFFLLFALFSLTRADYIYDSDGNILNNGGSYYILANTSFGAAVIKGASISERESSPCSLAVVAVASSSYDEGWPTKITTPWPLSFITNDYPLNISFASLPPNICTEAPNWIVTNVTDGFDETEPIMVGNFDEFPVPLSGFFYINLYNSTSSNYKFAFCYDKDNCGYVALKTDTSDNHRLVVTVDRTVESLEVMFVKATSDNVVSGVSMVV